MAGVYTPKTGKYANIPFSSYRQYLNQKSRDEGFRNFDERVLSRDEQRKLEDVSFQETKTRPNSNVKIDVYSGDNLYDMLLFASLLPPRNAVSVIVKTNRSIGSSKSTRTYSGYSTLIKAVKVSLFKKEFYDGTMNRNIQDELSEVDNITEVVLWVYR